MSVPYAERRPDRTSSAQGVCSLLRNFSTSNDCLLEVKKSHSSSRSISPSNYTSHLIYGGEVSYCSRLDRFEVHCRPRFKCLKERPLVQAIRMDAGLLTQGFRLLSFFVTRSLGECDRG